MKKETELFFGDIEEEPKTEDLFDISKRLERGYTNPVMNFEPNRFLSRVRVSNKFLISREPKVDVLEDENRILSYAQKQMKFAEKRAPVVLHVDKKQKRIVIDNMKENTKTMTKFLVEQIAPFSLSLNMSINESQQILNLITNDSGITLETSEFTAMSHRMTIIIAIQNLAKLLKLNKKWEEKMITLFLEKSFERFSAGNKNMFERLLAFAEKQKKEVLAKKGNLNETK